MIGRTSRTRAVLTSVLLALATWAAYWPVLHCQFTNYDDDVYVTHNSHVLPGLTWAGVRWAITSQSAGNWHPLTWMSHMLDCDLYGLQPAGHHATSLLIHTASSILLFLLLLRMTGAQWRSAFVAALFALHPLHVESVAWVAERKDVLSAFFFLLTIWAYARYAAGAKAEGGTGSNLPSSVSPPARTGLRFLIDPRYVVTLLAYALALLSKPMVVTLPFVLLLMDYWPLGRLRSFRGEVSGNEGDGRLVAAPVPDPPGAKFSGFSVLLEKVPFLVLTVFSCAITISAQGRAVGGLHLPLGIRAENAVVSYGRYMLKTVWPTRLVVLYPFSTRIPLWQVALAILAVCGLSWLAIRRAKRFPYLPAGWFWYLGTLVPVIGIVQVGIQSMADRYTYVPSIGLFLIIAWGGYDLLARWRLRPAPIAALAILPLALCLAATRAQVSHWKDSASLFQHALRWTADNYSAENNLGLALLDRGDNAAAYQHLSRAIQIWPGYADGYNNLGVALSDQGRTDAAIGCYRKAIQVQAKDPDYHHNLACALARKGEWDQAIAELKASLRLDPEMASARGDLARSFGFAGRLAESKAQWQILLQQEPDNVDAHINLGLLFSAEQDLPNALTELQTAARLQPGNPEVRFQLGFVLLNLGKNEEASRQLAEAARINPTNAIARFNLALAYQRLGEAKAAVEQYRAVLALDPAMPTALNNLAWILASHPDPGIRNGADAVRFAERACELTGYREPALVVTLAAAYAEAGRFQDATAGAEKAAALAKQAGNTALAGEYGKLAELFRSGKPYRAPAISR